MNNNKYKKAPTFITILSGFIGQPSMCLLFSDEWRMSTLKSLYKQRVRERERMDYYWWGIKIEKIAFRTCATAL